MPAAQLTAQVTPSSNNSECQVKLWVIELSTATATGAAAAASATPFADILSAVLAKFLADPSSSSADSIFASISSAPTTQLSTVSRYQCADGSLVASDDQCSATASSDDGASLSGGVIALIVIASVVVVGVVVAVILVKLGQRSKVQVQTPAASQEHAVIQQTTGEAVAPVPTHV